LVEDSLLCQYHSTAYQNLRESHEEWEKRAEVDWNEYLDSLVELETLGRWVREIIELLKSEDAPSELL
jgi:hypothetical protein